MTRLEHNVQRTAPKKIYLQTGDDPLDMSVSFDELMRMGDVSWCHDEIFASDVPYVRADIAVQLYEALKETLNNDGSTGTYDAMKVYDARIAGREAITKYEEASI